MAQQLQLYGIKYAIPGKSLEDNNPKSIGFTSGIPTLKDQVSGILSKQAAASSLTTVEVPHGLPYRPAFNGWFRDPSNGEVYAVASGFDDVTFNRSGSVVNVHMSSNNYNLVFAIYNTTGAAKNVDIFYEAFIDDLVSEPQNIPF
jgi:hypothetical protein